MWLVLHFYWIRKKRFGKFRLTPELTGAPHEAFNLRRRRNDEKHTIGASGSMSCSGALDGSRLRRASPFNPS